MRLEKFSRDWHVRTCCDLILAREQFHQTQKHSLPDTTVKSKANLYTFTFRLLFLFSNDETENLFVKEKKIRVFSKGPLANLT